MYQEAYVRFSKQELVRYGTLFPLWLYVLSVTGCSPVVIMAILSLAYVHYHRPDKTLDRMTW